MEDPSNFQGAPMVTPFIRLADNHINQVGRFLARAGKVGLNAKLAELEHPSFKSLANFCSGWVSFYVHPFLYRALKSKFPLNVGGLYMDGQVTTELGPGSLKCVGILTPKDFEAVVDSE